MKLFAVAGNPILHSKSPQVFASLFLRHRIDAAYSRLSARSAGELVEMARDLSLDGMNITAPLKEEIVPFLDIQDNTVKAIGAANTVINREGRLWGTNTDPAGVTGPFAKRKIRLAGKKCLVLGAGGAARAAVYALTREAADVMIVNRTIAKARSCASRIGGRAEKMTNLLTCLRRAEIVINTIPHLDDRIPAESLPESLVVLDARYSGNNPSRLAGRTGIIYIPGEEWLMHQAIPAFKHFTDVSARPLSRICLESTPYPAYKKRNIALIGFMGSGKTTTGRLLARSLDFCFVDTDEEIEKIAGCPVREIFSKKGEATFRRMEKEMMRRLPLSENHVVACGGGAILSSQNRSLLQRHSIVVWLHAPLEVMLHRARGQLRPLLATRNPLRAAKGMYAERKDLYFQTADLIVNANKDIGSVVECIRSEVVQIS